MEIKILKSFTISTAIICFFISCDFLFVEKQNQLPFGKKIFDKRITGFWKYEDSDNNDFFLNISELNKNYDFVFFGVEKNNDEQIFVKIEGELVAMDGVIFLLMQIKENSFFGLLLKNKCFLVKAEISDQKLNFYFLKSDISQNVQKEYLTNTNTEAKNKVGKFVKNVFNSSTLTNQHQIKEIIQKDSSFDNCISFARISEKTN